MKKSAIALVVAVLLVAAAGAFVVGCAKKAAKPNELNLLIFEGYGEPGWVDPFKAETGATINITNATSVDEIFSKMVADGGRGYDLVTLDTSQFPRYQQQKLIIPVNLKNVPNYRKETLPEFRDIKVTMFDGKQYGIPYAWGTIPMFYLQSAFPQAPDSWRVMWEPKYKGKIIVLDEPQNSMALMAMILGGVDNLWHFTEPDIARIKEGFQSLAPQIRTLTAGATDMINLIASGEAVVGMAFGEQTAYVANQKGLNVGLTIPREGATGWLDCWAISAGTQNQELAEKWINHTIIKKYNKMMSDTIGYPGASNPPEGTPASYDMKRIRWMEPRDDYQRVGEAWEEIKLLMGK
jgi:putative spermidine/putrescine transport system substrate-binding protein/spermidine/putrescine transport system substrate-binding protein